MNRHFISFVASLLLLSIFGLNACKNDPIIEAEPVPEESSTFISAADISSYPEIRDFPTIFYNETGEESDFLLLLQEKGINTVRIRLWVDPENARSSFTEVKMFSDELKALNFKTWITIHYSDSWADPSQQVTPSRWQNLAFDVLKDSVYKYTAHIAEVLKPDYVQIGNEINNGMLHPQGNIGEHLDQFLALADAGIKATRANSPETKIIMHFAGFEDADWFYNQIQNLDYDIIGLSYYPIWHGKDLNALITKMETLSETHDKEIMIAETSYPFTLDWNDNTNNVVGLDEHLILPEFPATKIGQAAFIGDLKSRIKTKVNRGIGLCYWGAELAAWKGPQSNVGSSWENQALFDFDNHSTPALDTLGN